MHHSGFRLTSIPSLLFVLSLSITPFAHGEGPTDSNAYAAENVAVPRDAVARPLLFSFVTNQSGFETTITISNTSSDGLGTTPVDSTCEIRYYGTDTMFGTFADDVSAVIPAGEQLVFTLAAGNPGMSIDAAPEFQGYIVADCGFPLARGFASIHDGFGGGIPTLSLGLEAEVLLPPRSEGSTSTLLIPFVSNQIGLDTLIVVSNTGLDGLGTTASDGGCDINYFGTETSSDSSFSIEPGDQLAFLLSSGGSHGVSGAPGFQGYVIIDCDFPFARAYSFVNDGSSFIPRVAFGSEAELISGVRDATPHPLLFPNVTNRNGHDTFLVIANTSDDTSGSTPVDGSCTITYVGKDSLGATPSAESTSSLLGAGESLVFSLSEGVAFYDLDGAPDFEGYVIADCDFPLARGVAVERDAEGYPFPLTSPSLASTWLPEVVPSSRDTTETRLLYPTLQSVDGRDTRIQIVNTSDDPLGTTPSSGTCTLHFEDGAGAPISDQATSSIAAGETVSFLLSVGSPAHGIAAVPNFSGSMSTSCAFGPARGSALLLPSNPPSTTGVFRPSDGGLFLKSTNESGFADSLLTYGLPGDKPIAGDWDGDGIDTIGVFRGGAFYLRNSNTNGFADITFAYGESSDLPVVGDWDGDGIDTVGVFRDGAFYLRNSNTAGPPEAAFSLGVSTDIPISGDWDGDGVDTVGVFRPTNGALYLKNQNSTGFADIVLTYGLPGDKPVTGDWDGNGTDTIGVFRDGTFYLRNSNTNGFAEITFALGIPSDEPISGAWGDL